MIRAAILIYLLLSGVFLVWHPDNFLKDAFVAPLIFIVPLGLGLLIARACFPARLGALLEGKLPIILLALFIGLTGHTVLYQQLERLNLLQPFYPVLYPSALCGAAFSFYREKELFRMEGTGHEWLTSGAMLIPLMALTYSFYFLKFSHYPLRDIFQETHFMKGAMELGRFHVLNPYTADSYIPLLQVHLGLLQDWYGYNLLASQWIFPVLCAMLRYASLHCFFSTVTDSRLTHTIAAGLAVITLHNLFSPTNGDMVFSLCLLLMAILVRAWAAWPEVRQVGRSTVFLMGVAVALYKLSSVQSIGIYWVLIVIGVACYTRMSREGCGVVACCVLLCATGIALHPAVALLYLFCALGLSWVHKVLHAGWPYWSEVTRARVVVGLLVVTGLMVVVAGIELNVIFEAKESRPSLSIVAEWILGKEITGAEGTRNTMIEWVRLAPPALVLLWALLSVSWTIAIQRKLISSGMGLSRFGVGIAPSLVFAWVGSVAGLLVSFSGMPYVHRALYFPLILFCLLVSMLIREEVRRYRAEGRREILVRYGILLLSYLVVSGRYGYKVPELGGPTNNPYLLELTPYFGLAVLASSALLVSALMAKSPWRVTILTLAMIFIGVVSDKFAVKSYGYRYSYGDSWSRERPLSHYTMTDLQMADRIRSLPPNTILFSDPYTLSILEAQTGFNGLYSFSNLGVMRQEYKDAVREILKCIEESMQGDCDNDELLAQVMKFITEYPGAVPEMRYTLEQRLQHALIPQEIKKDLLIVWNVERTFAWMNGQEEYFPESAGTAIPLDELQIAKAFKVIHNIDNTAMALRLN